MKVKPINGKPLNGAEYGIYDLHNSLIEELVIDENGTAVSSELIYGEYYIKEVKSVNGHIKDSSIYGFSIKQNDETVQIKIKRIPLSGSIEVCYLDISDGHELHEPYIYCDWIGMSNSEWMQGNEIDEIDIENYSIDKVDYPDNILLVEGKQVITFWYDNKEIHGEWKGVYIPKTGQKFPYLNYLAGIFCFMIAVVLMGLSHLSSKRGQKS